MLKRLQLLLLATAFIYACGDQPNLPKDNLPDLDTYGDHSDSSTDDSDTPDVIEDRPDPTELDSYPDDSNAPDVIGDKLDSSDDSSVPDDGGEIPAPDEPYLKSFVIAKTLNEQAIFQTITGTIGNEKITLVFSNGVDATNLIAEFEFNGIKVTVGTTTQESGVTANDFTKPLEYVVHGENGVQKTYELEAIFLDELRNAVPHIYITTDEGLPIDSKKDYRSGQLRIDGKGEWEDFEGDMEIRGRGGSTWDLPKKPYRIKLDKSASLFGLTSAKNWVLLANFVDTTHVGNALALKAGRLLDLPFTFHTIPVEVTVNDEYLGLYQFIEHKEVKAGRIDIGKKGILLELDTSFDEDYQFKSETYNLPVMIQNPELGDMAETEAESKFNEIKADFEALLALIDSNESSNDYRDLLDEHQLAKYLLVYLMSSNLEINKPKSIHVYKLADEQVYRMGPIWDFDEAYGYTSDGGKHFVNPTQPLFLDSDTGGKGTKFFLDLLESDSLQQLLVQEWNTFKTEHMQNLVNYLVNYKKLIRPSVVRDHELWELETHDFDGELGRILDWMEARQQYIDGWIQNLN